MENISNMSQDDILRTIRKRRNIYIILWAVSLIGGALLGLIPVVGSYITLVALIICGVFAGLGMICINNYRYIKTGGRKSGGGLLWIFLLIFGLIIIPFLTAAIFGRIDSVVDKIVGINSND